MLALGLDTSCYTTSAALCFQDASPIQSRRLLPVPKGERGLRQSEAVFAHVRQLRSAEEELRAALKGRRIAAVAARIGSTAFLLPWTARVPDSGRPPPMRNVSNRRPPCIAFLQSMRGRAFACVESEKRKAGKAFR